jgi:hypothetical protein
MLTVAVVNENDILRMSGASVLLGKIIVGRRELAKQSGVETLVSEGARHPIDPFHSLTTPFSRHYTTNVIEPDARHVGLAPAHWRAIPRPDGSNCLRAPATRILCQLLATIGAVACALRETTPKQLTATGLALPSRYRNRGRFSVRG